MTELNLVELILKLVKEWRAIAKPRQADLLRLCNLKYKEMEENHENFVRILADIQDIFDKTRWLRDKNNESPLEQIRILEKIRYDGRQKRLSQYEQASLYASELFTNRASLLKTVPNPIIEAVQAMMSSYVDYFNTNGLYDHELARVFIGITAILNRKAKDLETIKLQECDLFDIESMIVSAQSTFEMSWIRFSRDYYRAYATFADHGIFVSATNDPV